MKLFTKIILIAAVLSGTFSFSVHSQNGKVTVQAEADHPEQIIENTGKIISAAGSAIGELSEAAASASPAAASVPQPVAPEASPQVQYRIRNQNYDAASQQGAYCDYDTAVQMCPSGYCIFDMEGNLLYQAGDACMN